MGVSLRFESVCLSFGEVSRERNVYKRLLWPKPKGRWELFKNLSFELAPGEVVALVGPNGSGKTSILKMASGLLLPESGDILVDQQAQPEIERGLVGLMLTTRMLYEGLTGFQNLEYTAYLYGCEKRAELIQWAIDYWNLGEFIDSPVGKYSAGMRGRLALARATLHQPALLLLDEPSVFLDGANLQRLKDYLENSQATVLLTTHQVEILGGAVDRTLSLSELKAC